MNPFSEEQRDIVATLTDHGLKATIDPVLNPDPVVVLVGTPEEVYVPNTLGRCTCSARYNVYVVSKQTQTEQAIIGLLDALKDAMVALEVGGDDTSIIATNVEAAGTVFPAYKISFVRYVEVQ